MRFIGRITETELGLFESRPDTIKVLGFMPQKEALRQVEETDYLLLTMTNEYSLPGSSSSTWRWESRCSQSLRGAGKFDRILAATGTGWCAEPQDSAAIQAMIRRAWDMARSKEGSCGDGPRSGAAVRAPAARGRIGRHHPAAPGAMTDRMSERLHLLHIFPGFGYGGAELRVVRIINGIGCKARHTILPLNGISDAASRIAAGRTRRNCRRASANGHHAIRAEAPGFRETMPAGSAVHL